MQRRVKIPEPSPLTFASRSLTAQAAGNVKELEDDFKADKLVKDSKIATLESDKNDKDTRVAALESDKNDKDTKMSTMESDMTSLTSRVSTLESSGFDTSDLATKVSLGNLATRVSSLETLGISGISNAVSWTNLSEINLSGEKLTNGDFSSVTNNAPTNWTLKSGTLNTTELALGRIDGVNGAVSIQQMFSSPLAIGTKIIVQVNRHDTNTGNVGFRLIKTDGNAHGNIVQIPTSSGFVEYTVVDRTMAGIRLDTLHGTRSISSVSVFQGAVSGGSVQAYAGGGLEKISGGGVYNAGASSVQKIDGNSDGYVQFQLAFSDKSLKVGLVNLDHDFSVDTPWVANFGSGFVDFFNPYISNHTAVSSGDWFRIRHYAADNEIHFQRKQKIYEEDADFCLLQTCGLMPNNGHSTDHTFTTESRPLIKAKQTANGLTEGEYYRIYAVNTSTLHVNVYTTSGVWVGWMQDRGTHWQVQEELGEDYVTFYNHPVTTNGSDLYVDASFFSVGARINDVTIVT